jgi:hypothetical protein
MYIPYIGACFYAQKSMVMFAPTILKLNEEEKS